MLQSPILPLQLPHTHTTDCGGWPQELPSRCQGLQMSAAESYRQWRRRKAPTLPSGGISRSHRGPDAVWHLGGRCSIRTHYINLLDSFWEQPFLLSQLCPAILRAIASLENVSSIEQQERLLPQNSRDRHRKQQDGTD